MKIFLQPSDFSATDFSIGTDNDGGKIIQLNKGDIIHYTLSHTNNDVLMNPGDTDLRKRLYINNRFGYIHLDFTARKTASGNAFQLPSNSPTPITLLEVQTRDNGNIYITSGSRIIQFYGLTAGSRYIVDIIGFFR